MFFAYRRKNQQELRLGFRASYCAPPAPLASSHESGYDSDSAQVTVLNTQPRRNSAIILTSTNCNGGSDQDADSGILVAGEGGSDSSGSPPTQPRRQLY